ncbi:hypothetical protein YC2023_100349 [Brassica napus]
MFIPRKAAQDADLNLVRFNFPEGFPPRRGGYALAHFECEGKLGKMYGGYPNCALVKLYAKLGLHRYNWLEGTNFQLDRLKRFNMGSAATAYYITLVARLPTSDLQQIFQVVVEEERLGILDLTCRHSRPQVTESSKKETPFLRSHRQRVSITYKNRLLDWPSSEIAWPSSDIAFSDTKRFYVRDLSKCELEIVQVAIKSLDDKEPPSLKSKAVVIYITYKDLVKSLRIGEPCLCKAFVRRYSKKGSRIFRRRLGVHKLWRLSNPRWHQTHKNRSLRSLPATPAAKVRQNFEPKFFDDKLRGIGVVGREYTKEMSRPQSGRRTEELDRSFHEDMVHFDCESKIEYDKYPNCALVKFYAKLGFHHYNWLESCDLIII